MAKEPLLVSPQPAAPQQQQSGGRLWQTGRFSKSYDKIGPNCLGSGGMGSVWAARVAAGAESKEREGTWVAVKAIPLELGVRGARDVSALHQGLRECLSTFRDLSPKYVVRYDSYWLEEPHGLPPAVLSMCERRLGRCLASPAPAPAAGAALAAASVPEAGLLLQAPAELASPSGGHVDGMSLRFRECLDSANEGDLYQELRWVRTVSDGLIRTSSVTSDCVLTPSLGAFGGNESCSLGFIWEVPDEVKADDGPPSPPSSPKRGPRGTGERRGQVQVSAAAPSYAVLCIEMELMGIPPDQEEGPSPTKERLTLRSWLQRTDRTLSDAADVFGSLISSVRHIHRKRIVHADLKPDNIFCEAERSRVTSVRIGDFGLAGENKKDRQFSYGVQHTGTCITGGTPGYVAPEVQRAELERDPDFCPSEKVDIFACAVILLELLLLPFGTQMERFEVLDRFRALPTTSSVPDVVGGRLPKTRLLLQEMVEHDPADRLSVEEVCKRFEKEVRKELCRAASQLCASASSEAAPPRQQRQQQSSGAEQQLGAAQAGGGGGVGGGGGGGGGGGHRRSKGKKTGRRGG